MNNEQILNYYYELLKTASVKASPKEGKYLSEFAIIIKVIETIHRLQGQPTDYNRINTIEESLHSFKHGFMVID